MNADLMNKIIFPNLYLIVAMTEKTNSIGLNGGMIYHLKDDLKYFKEKTQNNTIICGRKTYYSFPIRPLPNRKNIVLTKSKDSIENCIVFNSKEKLLDYISDNPNEIFYVSGGENIYRQFIKYASKLYVTIIEENVEIHADTHFPEINSNMWKVESVSEYIVPKNAPKYRYFVFSRHV